MENEIYEILDRIEYAKANINLRTVERKKLAAKEITEMMMGFIEWMGSNYSKESGWRDKMFKLLGAKGCTTEELFQYWLTDIKDK